MDLLRELLVNLWVMLAKHLKDVLPADVYDGIVAKIPMPID